MSITDLNALLWRERELLEHLLFALETEQLVLASGRTRWLAHSTNQVESAITALRDIEVLRAAEADVVAAGLGLAHSPSLLALADAAGDPWRSLLLDQREAFMEMTTEINQIAGTNREMLALGQQVTREALLSLAHDGATYAPDGSREGGDAPRARLVDRSI